MECFVCNKRMNDGAPHITLPSSGGAVACPHCFEKEAGHYARILKRLAVRRVIGGFIQLALWVLGLGLIIFPGFREGDVWAVIVGLVLAGASGIAWGWNKGKNEVDWVDKKFTQHYVIAEDGYVHRDYGETAFNVFWRIFYVILGVILGVFITPYNVIMKFFDAGQYSRGAKHTRRLRDRLRASLPADSPYGKLHEAWNKQKDFVVFMCEKAKQDIAGTYLELMNAINDAQPILLELAGSPGGSEYWESIGLKLIEANDEIVKVFEAAGKDWQAASQRGIWELHRKLAELATWLNGLRAPVFATIDGDAGAGSGKKKGRRAIAIVTACIVGLSVVIFGINSYDTRTRLTYELVAGGYSVSEVFNGDKLRSVKIPATYDGLPVVAIGNNAFSGCGNLTSITIPSGVTDIGRGAFSGCSSLTSITIPPSVTVIKSHTFSGCSSLSSITISFGVTNIDDAAFNDCGSLASVTIPSSVTRIGGYAFRGCGSLVSITIPSSVTGIGDSAFSGCSSLTSVTIPSSVTRIGGSAFYGCNGLTSMTIPFVGESRTADTYSAVFGWIFGYVNTPSAGTTHQYSSGRADFYYYVPASLKTVVITDAIYMGSAFHNCGNLTSITISSGVTFIAGDTFSGCSSLASIMVEASTAYKDIDGVLFDKDGTRLVCYPAGKSGTSYVIPYGVTSIGYGAFFGCGSLTSITIPSSVTSIGGYAFRGCGNLTSITIPSGVTEIGDYAFYNCSGLTIYAAAASQPVGWNTNWNPDNRPVVWNSAV